MDWKALKLIVFDVDGTLYDQRALRQRMLIDIIRHSLASRSLATLHVLRIYRALREMIGDEEIYGFDDVLLERTAQKARVDKASVQVIVDEWIHRRPLAYLRACRYPGVKELFVALRESGKKIGVFSDYPALDKLDAMGLEADFVTNAADPNIGILKPHPRGLETIIAAAGVSPLETLMIGDRIERDGEAARRAGVMVLIRTPRPIAGWPCFAAYASPIFQPLLDLTSPKIGP